MIIGCEQTPLQKTQNTQVVVPDLVIVDQPSELDKPMDMEMSKSKADYDTILWSEIAFQENQIQIDLRYASENNFVKEQLYDCPRCFLRPEAAVALYDVQESLQEKGYRLKLFDCYRPTSIQKKLWEKVPNASYVTPPNKGSMHNRGYAVDATLINAEGMEVNMGTEFDYFGRRAHHDNRDLDSDILKNRDLLKNTMAEFGFKHIRTEWWHYSFQGPYQSPFKLADFQWSCEETH
jgi:D-alanyl-D-alanine dipeptidase